MTPEPKKPYEPTEADLLDAHRESCIEEALVDAENEDINEEPVGYFAW